MLILWILLTLLTAAAEPIQVPLAARSPSLAKRDGLGFSSSFGLPVSIGTPPQSMVLPIHLGGGRSGFRDLVLSLGGTREWQDQASVRWFIANDSRTFSLSQDTKPAIPAANLSGLVAHDALALNGLSVQAEITMLDPKALWDWIFSWIFNPGAGRVEDWLMYDTLGNDGGALGFQPDSTFVRSLLGGKGDVGLFIAHANPSAPGAGHPPFYDYNAGEIVLGGLNPELYTGDVAYVPLTSTEAWETDFSGVRVGEHSAEGGTVHFHTSNVVYMKRSLADATLGQLALNVSHNSETNSTAYTVPCETTATLALTIAGKEYMIPPSAWVNPRPHPHLSSCSALVVAIPDERMSASVYAGSPFLRSVYTVLRFGEGKEAQIGFAALSDAARGVVPERIEGSATPTGVMPGYSAAPSNSTARSAGEGVGRSLRAVAVALVMLVAVF